MMYRLITRSTIRHRTRQGGYALILMLVTLMGIGGVVITGFTQGAIQETEHERYLHNQRVLKEAKQALLQYAYNYPQLGPGQNDGPGRLPCPDIDNDGLEDFNIDCVDTVPNPDVPMVGRLPWRDPALSFYEAKDASGERLWYAVSDNFARGLGSFVNSDTVGSITIQDPSGAVLYDGAVNGVAAVIIAPGAPIERNGNLQDRSIANADNPSDTTADDDPGIINADRYLDLFGAIDNADFVNGTADGFVTGPIDNRVNGVLQVNDQMIVITAAEVIEMAEKATLQAYRDAINVYLDNVACDGETPAHTGITEVLCLANGGVWNPVYPWLYNYRDVTNIAELSSYYPAFTDFDDERDPDPDPDPDSGYLDNYGRIPSIFGAYFAEGDSLPIETRLGVSVSLIESGAPDTFSLVQDFCDASCGTGGTRTFSRDPDPGVQGPRLDIDFGQPLTNVGFVDVPDVVGQDGRLMASLPADQSIPFHLYFWGEHDNDGTNWTACPGRADELSDCIGLGSDRSILHLEGMIDFSSAVAFDFNYSFPPAIIRWNANSTSHAGITGSYAANAIISFPGVFSSVRYEYDGHWHDGDTSIDSSVSNDDYSTGNVDMTGVTVASLLLGMRYYPELPGWALDNGWHDSIRMAYADSYLPSLATPCTPGTDCLSLPEEKGAPGNIASLLVIAGQHGWVDDNADAPVIVGLEDELRDVFDIGNHDTDRLFYTVRGNDKILVIDEL